MWEAANECSNVLVSAALKPESLQRAIFLWAEKENRRSLHCASPDFLSGGRFGRDDKFGVGTKKRRPRLLAAFLSRDSRNPTLRKNAKDPAE